MVTAYQDHALLAVESAVDRLRAPGVLEGNSKRWGPLVWDLLHSAIEVVPCDTCQKEGRILVSAIHDAVNAHLGKPVRDPRALCTAAAQLAAVASAYPQCDLSPFVRCERGAGFD